LRVRISKKDTAAARACLDEISVELDAVDPKNPSKNIDPDLVKFAEYAARRSADTTARVYRAQYICRKLKASLK